MDILKLVGEAEFDVVDYLNMPPVRGLIVPNIFQLPYVEFAATAIMLCRIAVL